MGVMADEAHPRVDPPTLDVAALLEHAAWARALAAHLVHGAADADDLVQETWLAALRRPPETDRPLRPWLATVLRRLASRRRRDDGRRARRETAAAAREDETTVPASDEIASALEARRLLGVAVSELPEPFRTTVYLRYYDGLDGNEVAARTGVPPGTARWRLARGIALLRERLDARTPGGRGAWCALLLPLVPRSLLPHSAATAAAGGTAAAGAITMATTTKVVAAAAVVLVLATATWVGIEATHDDAPPREDVAFVPETSGAAEESPRERAHVATTGDAASESDAAAPDERTAVTPPAADAPGPLLRGRLVGPSGIAVAHGWVRVGDEDPAFETPCAADGTFALHLRGAPDARRVRLDAGAEGCGSESVRVDAPADGIVEVGDIELGDGGSIEGRVVDTAGAPVPGASIRLVGESYHAELLETARRMPIDLTRAFPATVSDESGHFVLPGVRVGAPRLWAAKAGWLGSPSGVIEVRARQRSTGVRIVLERPSEDELVRVLVQRRDGTPAAGAVVRYAYDGDRVSGTNQRTTDDAGRLEILLGPGRIRWLTASGTGDDGEQVTRTDVARGSSVTLRLGSAPSVELRVRGGDGAPLGEFGWEVLGEDGSSLAVEGRAARADGTARVTLPQGRGRIAVDAPGHAIATTELLDTAALPDHVDLVATPLPGISGRVLLDGVTRAGVTVELVAAVGTEESVQINGRPTRCEFEPAATTTTREDGSFALTMRDSGRWFLRVRDGAFAALCGPYDIAADAGRAGLEVSVGRPGAIEGVVVVDAGRSPAGVLLAITNFDGLPRTIRTDANGRFRAEGLAPGPWLVGESEFEIRPDEVVTTRAAGRERFEANCDVPPGGTATLQLDLRAATRPTLRIAVRVNGRPAAGARVALLADENPFGREESIGTLDADGRAQLAAGAPRRGVVRIVGADGPAVHAPVELGADAQLDVAWETGTVEVTGVAADAARTVVIVVLRDDGLLALAELRADGEGRLVARDVPTGRVRVVAAAAIDMQTAPAAWAAVDEGVLTRGALLGLSASR